MAVIEALLAAVGVIALALLALGVIANGRTPNAAPSSTDPAQPYREGLHGAIRMQRLAQDLEYQLQVEAAKHRGIEADAGRNGAPSSQ